MSTHTDPGKTMADLTETTKERQLTDEQSKDMSLDDLW